MGRAILNMELIAKPKSRILTFKKRKEGMMKKLHELTTLCDVDACMIIYDPTQNQTSIWPEQKTDQVRRLIDTYVSARRGSATVTSYGVSDFLEEKRRKVEEEMIKLRKKNSELKFPDSDHDYCLNFMDESQLRELGAALRCKAQIVKSRIQFLKNKEMETINNTMLLHDSDDSSQFGILDQEIFNHLIQFYNLDQEIMPAATDMDMIASQYYYAPPPLLPALPPQPCLVYSLMKDLNYYSSMV